MWKPGKVSANPEYSFGDKDLEIRIQNAQLRRIKIAEILTRIEQFKGNNTLPTDFPVFQEKIYGTVSSVADTYCIACGQIRLEPVEIDSYSVDICVTILRDRVNDIDDLRNIQQQNSQ